MGVVELVLQQNAQSVTETSQSGFPVRGREKPGVGHVIKL